MLLNTAEINAVCGKGMIGLNFNKKVCIICLLHLLLIHRLNTEGFVSSLDG